MWYIRRDKFAYPIVMCLNEMRIIEFLFEDLQCRRKRRGLETRLEAIGGVPD